MIGSIRNDPEDQGRDGWRSSLPINAERAEGVEQSEQEDESKPGASRLPARERRRFGEGHPWFSEREPVGERGGDQGAVQGYRTGEGNRAGA